jgi:putative aminopeptidase FrvX
MSAANYQTKPNMVAPEMPDKMVRWAYTVFSLPSSTYNEASATVYICEVLKQLKIKYEIDTYGNVIATRGEAPYACCVAHLDTVHTYKNGFVVKRGEMEGRHYFFAEDNTGKRVGVGGDDKCGVFVCLYLLSTLTNIRCVFFTQEESGGIGSSNIDLKVFEECRYVGGVDRWGGRDMVNRYSGDYTISKDFYRTLQPLMKRYDYEFTTGLFTDSLNLWERNVGVSCFNVSCGYYSHHSDTEYVDLQELWNACLFCTEIAGITGVYKKEGPKWKNWKNTQNWNKNWDKYDDEDWYSKYDADKRKTKTEKDRRYVWEGDTRRKCECCHMELFEYEDTYCTVCKPYFRDLPAVQDKRTVWLDPDWED